MKPHDSDIRDAIVSFQCFGPDFVRVSESIGGESVHHQEVPRHPDVVTELEEKYIFFAKNATLARKQIMQGQSCAFNVYFREP